MPVRLPITVGQFLKLAGLAASGGEAKALVTEGKACVNGAPETRRGHKLQVGDIVEVGGRIAVVATQAEAGNRSLES